MADMLLFCSALLDAIAEFMSTPPLLYLFGMIILAVVVKIVMMIIRPS